MNKPAAIILCCTVGVMGQLLIKKGLSKIGQFEVSEIFTYFTDVLTNSHIMGAILLYGGAIFVYLSLLSRIQLSTLYPVMIGIDFVILSAASYLLFGEAFSSLKIVGLVLIILGVSCLSYAKI